MYSTYKNMYMGSGERIQTKKPNKSRNPASTTNRVEALGSRKRKISVKKRIQQEKKSIIDFQGSRQSRQWREGVLHQG
jgi:hypothetical protein